MRFFNVAGPCNPEDHYMLPATARLPDVQTLIDQKAFFVIHGLRQSGKTTAMLELARQLTATGRYAAALVSMEVGAAFNDDPSAAELAILEEWRAAAGWQLPAALQPPPWPDAEAGGRLGAALAAWCLALRRPLILFLDEIDALQGMTLIAVLRQLRVGFQRRPCQVLILTVASLLAGHERPGYPDLSLSAATFKKAALERGGRQAGGVVPVSHGIHLASDAAHAKGIHVPNQLGNQRRPLAGLALGAGHTPERGVK